MPRNEDQKLQVQQATDLVRLIGEQVALKPKGKEYLGLCPFHEDHSPSLNVSPVKQIYKCFSCGAGGDAFSFVMNFHKMTFPEALRYLAERAGIELAPQSQQAAAGASGQRQRILQANSQAVDFFRALLRHPEHGRLARGYLQQRKISQEMVDLFQLGYAADRWDGLSVTIRERSWDRSSFEQAGLISQRTGGEGHYDRLRHRLIFPILDELNRPIGFGGRKLRDDDEPKYLNSPETILFNKSATLYGLPQAKSAILASQTAVIVEGYTDVIACHQAKVKNVVATLGTALTREHVTHLRRYAQKVVLIFDADDAGYKAADRAVEVFLTEPLDVAVAVLPDELDPAELFERPDGSAIWIQCVEQAVDALTYLYQRMNQQFGKSGTLTGQEQIVQAYLQRLVALGKDKPGPLRQRMVDQRLSHLLGIDDPQLRKLLEPIRKATASKALAAGQRAAATGAGSVDITSSNASSSDEQRQDSLSTQVVQDASAHKIKALQLAERELIGALLCMPALFHLELADGRTLDEGLTPQELVSRPAQRLYQRLYDRLSEGAELTVASFTGELAADGEQDLCDLATSAEMEVAAMAFGPEQMQQLARDAAGFLQDQQRGIEYRRARQAVGPRTTGSSQASPASAAPAEEAFSGAQSTVAASDTAPRTGDDDEHEVTLSVADEADLAGTTLSPAAPARAAESGAQAAPQQIRAALEALAHLRANPSPLRIARVGR